MSEVCIGYLGLTNVLPSESCLLVAKSCRHLEQNARKSVKCPSTIFLPIVKTGAVPHCTVSEARVVHVPSQYKRENGVFRTGVQQLDAKETS